jgi:hypothetical protein
MTYRGPYFDSYQSHLCFILCAHIASQKCDNYACQHAPLRRPDGDTYMTK